MVKVKEGFFKRQEALSNDNVLLAHGGHKPLSEFKIGDYLPIAGGTMTGNIYFNSTNKGIFLKDSENNIYPGIYQNNSNLWIGAVSTDSSHHSGSIYISAGGGNAYISRLVNGVRTNYKILDSGNSSVSGGGSTWGASITVKINNTEKTLQLPSDPNHVEVPGSTNQLAHYKTTSLVGPVTATIGASNKIIYIKAGVPTASGASVGTAAIPIYLDGGVIKAVTGSQMFSAFGSTGSTGTTGTYITIAGYTRTLQIPYATSASKLSVNAGNTTQAIYFANGVPTALTGTTGATNQPIYLNGGKFTPITHKLNATVLGNTTINRLVHYSSANEIGPVTATIGASNKIIYINGGVPTASGASIGSSSQPIYLNSGVITAGQSYDDYINGRYVLKTGDTMTGDLTMSKANIFIDYDNTTQARIQASNTNGKVELLAAANRGLYDRTNTKWIITTNGTNTYLECGNVGIGTASPTYKLQVAGDGYFSGGNVGATITYNSRDVWPTLRVNGVIYANNNIETATSFINNRGSVGGGYYLMGNNTTYGRLFINVVGTAATSTSGSTVGIAILQLGNSIAKGATGTTDGANNARGVIQIYNTNNNYTSIYSQSNANRIFYLPAYGGESSETGHMYAIHAGSNAAVGTATRPVYIAANGRVTVGTYELKATINVGTQGKLAYYSGATSISSYDTTVGANNKIIYINGGIPTASDATVGSATNGIYLAGGVLTKMTYNLNATVNSGTANKLAYYSSATTISSATATVGNSIQPIYLNAGVPTVGATYFFIAHTALYGGKGATNINFNIPDSTRLSGTYYLNTSINGVTTAFQNAPQNYGLVVDFNQFAGHLQFSSTSTANVIKARSYWWTGNTGFTYPSWVTLIHTGNYTDYLGYIATTPVKSGSTAGQNITGTGNITPNATDTYDLGSTTLLWQWTHTNRINLNRKGNEAFGRIYYWNSVYYTWVDYMSQSSAGFAPTGGQPSTTTEVTSWAKRSLIENTAGYGWIWEATTNAAAGATNTKPTARMSLSSNTGRLRIESASSTTDNNTGGLIISSALNASSGNIALELWRGTKASWMISNEAGDLHIRDNYTTAAQTTYLHDNVKISYNTGTITAHSIQPVATNTYNLGTSSLRWAKLYIGTADSYGSATKPIYWNAGVPAACTYDLKVNVLPGSTLSVAYYSKPDEISASSSVKILSGIGATSGATLYGISITGNGRGYANQLVSGVTGLFSYGDGGPQIRFIDDTQALSLIATRYDGGGGNMSLHLVSDQPRVVFATQEIVAHNRLSVGVNVPNTTYGTYLNTSTAHNTGHIYLLGISTSSSTSNTTQIVFGPTTVASQHVALSSNSKALIINPNVSSTTGQVYLGVNGNNSYFSSSGNVGIGNTTPAYKLHVAGNGYISTYLGVATAPRTDYKLATLSAYVYGATVSATYAGRTIAPNLNTGVVWLNSVEATTHYMLNRGATGGGYFCYINNTQYARLYVGATGTASSDSAQGAQGWAMIELGNNIARGATGTTNGTNNACGYVRLWASNQYYTQIRAQGNGSHTVYLPNHTTDMYLVHAGNNNAVGDAYTPVYVAANGRVTPSSVTLNRTSYIASNTASLSSYWCKAWDATITDISAGGERHMQLLVTSEFQSYRGIISLRIRQVGANDSGAYNFTVTLVEIVGNIPLDRFRLYYNNSTGLCQLWGNVNIRYGSFSFTCLKKTARYGEVNEFGTFYNTTFTTAQTLPSDPYVEMTVSGHYMGSSYFVNGHLYLDGAVAADSTANTTQIVYRAAGTQQVALSSNTNALIINPTTSGTTGQIYLGVNGKNTYFSSSGNVGIGTTAPTYKLDVRANMSNWAFHVYNYDASGHASFYIARSNSNAGIWGGISSTASSAYLMSLKNGTTGDGAGGNSVFYVGGDGLIGIGTSSPSYKLHLVNGYIGNTVTYTTADNGVAGMYLSNKDSDTGNTSIGRIYLYNGHNDNNNGNLIVQATGGVVVGGGEGVFAFRNLVGNNIESTHIVADTNVILEANLGANSNDASGRIGAGVSTSGNFIPVKETTWSNAQTQTLGTSSYHWGKLFVGPNDSYGTATKPIYWNAGVPAACTYELKATVNAGTANRIAYYSSATAISAASTLVSDGTYIRRAAVSSNWNNTDDNSMIYQNTVNGLGAVLSVKTTNNHSWSIAHYSNASYHTDLLFGFLHADDHTGATEPVNRWRDCISLIPVTDAGTSRRAFVTAPYTRSSATNGKASVGNSTTPVYVDAKGIVVAGQSYAGYGDNRYVLKAGDTMTGTLTMSAANILVSYTNTNDANVRTTNSNGSVGILTSSNRGLYDYTKTQWVIATNGTNTWLPQGNVGIGNTAPGYKLDVSGTIRATGNISITSTGKGYFLTDADSHNYPAAFDNGENLWIGSTATKATHHKGQTFISSGYGSTTGNATIRISVPNDANDNATNYYAYHSGYHPFLNSGTTGKLAYYSGALVISSYTTTVGTSARPVYMNAGVPTALTATIGTSTKPIYMSSGVMTASAASVGSSIRPIYLASGVMTAGATVSTLKGSFYDMKVLWCGIVSKSGATSASYSLNKKGGLCDASVSFSSNTVTVSLSAVSSGSGISGSINICNAIPVVGNWTQRNSSNNYNMGLVTITITSLLTSSVSFQGYARKSDNTHWRINTALGSSWVDGDDVVRITSFYVTIFGFIS